MASSDTAAVRRPVTTCPSNWHTGLPVVPSHTVIRPWIVGNEILLFRGCTR